MSKSIFDTNNYCINCGSYNHKKKNCPEPVISYGIIVYKKEDNKFKYLLIKRKDTISYIHLLRGKYNLEDNQSIITLLIELTNSEKQRILRDSFQQLWCNLWLKKKIDIKNIEFLNCQHKFNNLLEKINNDPLLTSIMNTSKWYDTEWGFPKGRRNYKETDLNAAKREFQEETNIDLNDIKFSKMAPIKEQYVGNDNIIYRHEYYIAEYISENNVCIDYNNINQMKEISDIQFMDMEKCIEKIRDYHIEKKNIIINLEEKLVNGIC